MNLTTLTTAISELHESLRGAAVSSVNKMLTARNWLIGRYIVEYEQKGEDRATYGSGLMERLSAGLLQKKVKGTSVAALRNCRQFYSEYQQLGAVFIYSHNIGQKHFDQFNSNLFISPPDESPIQQEPPVELDQVIDNKDTTTCYPSPAILIKHFSFTHFVELMRLDDSHKRTFYEVEGINGCWSVPQLKRQIESLLYERTGLSRQKHQLIADVNAEDKTTTIDQIIRDPYILEFTGLPERAFYSEADLETALLDHLQSFLLELGNGFCFEARG
jgi:predicted nuclease of restriction endonuclease-like (RecB) superfamily